MVYEGKEVTAEDDTRYSYGNYAKMVMWQSVRQDVAILHVYIQPS